MGGVINTIRTVAENAPRIIKIAKKGYKLGSEVGGKLTSAARNVNGLFTSRRSKQTSVVSSAPGTQSQNRPIAPTSLAVKFDGPEYKFSSCTYQGMHGLKISCTFAYCSIEQNTNTALRGALRDMSVAGIAGDTSMQGTTLSPVTNYFPSVTKGRVGMTATWLYSIANAFRKFRITGFGVKFESELPTTSAGGLALGFDADAGDTLLAPTALSVTQYGCSLLTSVWDDAYLDCSRSLDKTLKNTQNYVTGPATLLQNLSAAGTLFAVFDQANAANLVVGKLLTHWEIEFYSPAPLGAFVAATLYQAAKKVEAKEKVYQELSLKCEEAQKLRDAQEEKAAAEYFEVVEPHPPVAPIAVPSLKGSAPSPFYISFPK